MVLRPPLVAGSWFHSLHATSHALHPMHTVVSVKNPIGSAITPPLRSLRLLHVADEGLALVDGHVGIAHERGELVARVARAESLVAPVPRQADLVDDLSVDAQRPQPARHERLGADGGARTADLHPVDVLDALLGGKL